MSACVEPVWVQKVAFGAIAAWIEQEIRREWQTAPKEDPKRGRRARSAAPLSTSHRRSSPCRHQSAGCRVGTFGLPCRRVPSAAG